MADLPEFTGPIELNAEDRWGAIRELVGHLVLAQKIKAEDEASILRAVIEREKAMSTGVVPLRCRTPQSKRFQMWWRLLAVPVRGLSLERLTENLLI